MNKLLFLSNELMNPTWQRDMNIPLHFISFAHIEGRMFKHFRNQSTFVTQHINQRTWGNTKVYGAIFLLEDFDFYAELLDAYMVCSLSRLKRNHIKDIHHRMLIDATPIYFDTLNDFQRLLYKEQEKINCYTYMGNLNQPNITKRISQRSVSYRIESGVHARHFKQLHREVMYETDNKRIRRRI